MFKGAFEKTVVQLLDTGSRLQGPAVAKYVDRIRRSHPSEKSAQIIERLEGQYLLAVTGSGVPSGRPRRCPASARSRHRGGQRETTFFMEASPCSPWRWRRCTESRRETRSSAGRWCSRRARRGRHGHRAEDRRHLGEELGHGVRQSDPGSLR